MTFKMLQNEYCDYRINMNHLGIKPDEIYSFVEWCAIEYNYFEDEMNCLFEEQIADRRVPERVPKR